MPSPRAIAAETVAELAAHLPAVDTLAPDARRLAEAVVYRGVMRQLLRDIWEVDNHADDPAEALLRSIDPDVIRRDPAGRPVTADTATPHWREWHPGLDNDDQTLGAVLATLPGFEAEAVPVLVRLFENPASPIALAGACTLAQHDAVHVLIGRGLVDQDEAFVIGFTAGAAADLSQADVEAYRVALSSYAEPYRIGGRDLLAFDLGIQAGRVAASRDLHAIDVEAYAGLPLGQAREQLGIDTDVLRGFYRLEQRVIPGTPASLRLPTG